MKGIDNQNTFKHKYKQITSLNNISVNYQHKQTNTETHKFINTPMQTYKYKVQYKVEYAAAQRENERN